VSAWIVLVVALIAFATALFTTPYVRRLALNVGMLDATGERRMHDQPKPRIGGIAVYLGFALALFAALGYLLNGANAGKDLKNLHDLVGLIFGGTLILMVGIWDDVMGMSPRAKLFAQCAVAAISMLYGFQIQYINDPLHHGHIVFFPVWISLALTMLSGVTVISSISMIAIALSRNHAEIALVLAALAGGALGFLRYNWNPAKIILGDSGALFIGYIFATVSIIGASKTAFAISLLVPLVVLALPVLDTVVTIVRRTTAGKKFYEADRGHFHHQLIFRFGLNVRQAVLLIYVVCVVLGVIALVLAGGVGSLKLALHP
jgi:UDP-GlcNAc:undecaprenyl-phosphate GlcNAc-1-phosphate transferase